MGFEILRAFHHKIIEYIRIGTFLIFSTIIFEILTAFHHKLIEYIQKMNFFNFFNNEFQNPHSFHHRSENIRIDNFQQ